ncbi:L-2-hydroxyglutarate oxidase [Sinomonas sp. G460-2]|uniref:L-2-hydroxyglutarate oxidase n=1 Tax=Sinomonas sp. G460-2 TaxID=3393464 RepID=UPI0039EE079B
MTGQAGAARIGTTRIGTERVGIVGGGIVGMAIARALALTGGFDVSVLEKERRVAAHQTGHNSGVVHAGLYYQPGSLKAALCARGRGLTRDYCEDRGLPYRELGKLVVAVTPEEMPRLDEIERRAGANGVPDLARIGPERMRELEPHVAGVGAVHSPHTAVVDFAAITEAMASDVRRAGGRVLLGTEVVGVRAGERTTTVATLSGTHTFDRLIVCAGLQSDLVARMVGASPSPRILPFRGEYWTLAPARASLVRGMIYPVPDPRFPFLGVHFTRGVYDDVHVGPNAVPALAREGYRWGSVSVRDTVGSLAWPGAAALFRQHWRMGVREVSASVAKSLYYRQARAFVPELRPTDLAEKTAAGVRAQAWAADGSLLDDFAVDQVGSVTLLRNAPSPAATSSMAIAEYVLREHLGVALRDG